MIFFYLTAILAFVVNAEVLELNVSNFKNTVLGLEKGKGLFVKFYAPWCGHCKRLAPVWDALSDRLKDTHHTIAHIDTSDEDNRIIGKYFGIRGYPTLKLFRDGKVFDYKGGRDEEDIFKWVTEESYLEPAIFQAANDVTEQSFVVTTTTTTTVQVIHPILDLTDTTFEKETQAATGATTGSWLVKFYTPWCGHCKRLAPEWQKLANMVDINTSDLQIAQVDLQANPDLQTRFGIKSYPSIMLFHKGNIYQYNGARNADALLKWYESGTYKTATTRPVPPVLTFFSRIEIQATDMFNEIVKLYSTMFSKESVSIIFKNQPILAVGGSVIVFMTTVLIAYQVWSVFLGMITGVPRDVEEQVEDKKNQ